MEIIKKIMRQQDSLCLEFPDSSDIPITHWAIFDTVFTNMRIVFVQAKEITYSPIAAAGVFLGLAGINLMKAYEKYQSFKQEQKLDLQVIESLLENSVALSIEPSDIYRIVIAQVKVPLWAKVVATGDIKMCWVIIEGKVRLGNEKKKCIVGFCVDGSKKATAEYVEKNILKKPFLIQAKVDKIQTSFREILSLL